MTLQDFEAIASIVTAAGVIIAAISLRYSWKQARTDFEDDLNREYRDLSLVALFILGSCTGGRGFDPDNCHIEHLVRVR